MAGWQQEVTEMAEQDVEQWVQDTEAKAAAMEAALDGYGQHRCGGVVVLGGAEAATKAAAETTEAKLSIGRGRGRGGGSGRGSRGGHKGSGGGHRGSSWRSKQDV